MARLLEAAPGLSKYKAALSVSPTALDLRSVSEVANLKVSDIDSHHRMTLRVEQGQGGSGTAT